MPSWEPDEQLSQNTVDFRNEERRSSHYEETLEVGGGVTPSPPEARPPTKEELAQMLRDYPTWGHAAVAEKDRAERAEAELRELREALRIARDFIQAEGYETKSIDALLAASSEEPG